MLWISIGTEAGLLIWIALEALRWRKSRRTVPAENAILRILYPAAHRAAQRLMNRKRAKDSRVYRMMCQLVSEEEADGLYEKYCGKRCAIVLGMMVLCSTCWTGYSLAAANRYESLSAVQNRPAYGEGDEKKQVTLTLVGLHETVQRTFSLCIPEKAISVEEAENRLDEAMQYISSQLEGKEVDGDIRLPAGWEDVAFSYESLSPELVRNDGRWVGELQQESQPIQLLITAKIGGQQKQKMLTLYSASLKQLSAQERLAMIQEKVQAGEYTTESEIRLPEETELGETLIWNDQPKSNIGILLFLLAVRTGCLLWKQEQEYRLRIRRREQDMRRAYPEFINELVILIGAGLSLPAAWRRIGEDYRKQQKEETEMNPLYEEIYREGKQLEAGASMREMLEEFILHIRLREARHFAILLIQNMRRGDAFLVSRLRDLNQEAWELRKKLVREKSEEVDTKLLLPLMLMLVVILIIVLAPAMISMQV